MSNLPEPRPPVKPAELCWQWLYRCGSPGPRLGVLEICGIPYAVTLIEGGIELRKDDPEGTRYHVCTCGSHGWTCDCPDAEFRPRPGGCKHVANLKPALVAIHVILPPHTAHV